MPEKTIRERPAIFRRTAKPQDDVETSVQDDKTASGQIVKPPKHPVKLTVYLGEEDLWHLEEVRLARLRSGKKVDKSELIREAIRNLSA